MSCLLGGKGERIPLEVEVKTEEERCCIVLMGSLILIPPALLAVVFLTPPPPLKCCPPLSGTAGAAGRAQLMAASLEMSRRWQRPFSHRCFEVAKTIPRNKRLEPTQWILRLENPQEARNFVAHIYDNNRMGIFDRCYLGCIN